LIDGCHGGGSTGPHLPSPVRLESAEQGRKEESQVGRMEIPSTGSGQALHCAKNAPFRMTALFEGRHGGGRTGPHLASPVRLESAEQGRDQRVSAIILIHISA
jgi:hypothetical protein